MRTTPDRESPDENGVLLLIGGGGHKVGEVTNTEEQYQKVEDYGREHFGIDTFDYRWSTQDMVSFDKLPYIGNLTPGTPDLYVATGFSLWGMTNGTLAGMLLSDMILGITNPWADLYDSTRITPFVTPEGIKQTISVGMHWMGDQFKGLGISELAQVEAGEGQLVTINSEKIAAYRDEQGTIHTISAVCPHLGCILAWNNAEKSWDCPCHGSRFGCDGGILHGPATTNLKVHPASTKTK